MSQELADVAEDRGSADNTTVVVVFLQPVSTLLIKYAEGTKMESSDDANSHDELTRTLQTNSHTILESPSEIMKEGGDDGGELPELDTSS